MLCDVCSQQVNTPIELTHAPAVIVPLYDGAPFNLSKLVLCLSDPVSAPQPMNHAQHCQQFCNGRPVDTLIPVTQMCSSSKVCGSPEVQRKMQHRT